MAFSNVPLPPDVIEALGRGRTIEAIKRLRKANGLGLAEAKSAIESYLRSTAAAPSSSGSSDTGRWTPDAGRVLPAAVLEALQRGDRNAAVRLLRERTGLGLTEARSRIEAAGGAVAAAVEHRLEHRIEAPRQPVIASRPGLAPGEVPRSNAALWLVLALGAIAAAGYYLLQ